MLRPVDYFPFFRSVGRLASLCSKPKNNVLSFFGGPRNQLILLELCDSADLAVSCSSQTTYGASEHNLRHTKAMRLLQAGVSPVTIKDILGHAHLKTVETYVQADLEMKRRALESTQSPVDEGPATFRPEPDLLHWLEQL